MAILYYTQKLMYCYFQFWMAIMNNFVQKCWSVSMMTFLWKSLWLFHKRIFDIACFWYNVTQNYAILENLSTGRCLTGHVFPCVLSRWSSTLHSDYCSNVITPERRFPEHLCKMSHIHHLQNQSLSFISALFFFLVFTSP